MTDTAFKDAYCRSAMTTIGQLLHNSSCVAQTVTKFDSKANTSLLNQPAPNGAIVVIWDVYLASPMRPGGMGPYIGSLRMEFSTHLEIQSTIKALNNLEGTLHQAWLSSSLGDHPCTAEPLPAWCMAPVQD